MFGFSYVCLWGEIKAGAAVSWDSRISGLSSLASCRSDLGRALQERSYYYQQVLKQEEDLAS